MLRNDLMSNTDPIMYQLYIGALLKLTLNMAPLVAFYTCVLSLLGPWLWYRFLRELQDSKTLALAGWVASIVAGRGRMGCFGNVIIGVLGAFIGGFLVEWLTGAAKP